MFFVHVYTHMYLLEHVYASERADPEHVHAHIYVPPYVPIRRRRT